MCTITIYEYSQSLLRKGNHVICKTKHVLNLTLKLASICSILVESNDLFFAVVAYTLVYDRCSASQEPQDSVL